MYKTQKQPTDFRARFKKYKFEVNHLLLIFAVLSFFLILVSSIQKSSLQNLLLKAQDWYQQDFAERQANLTATSLELLVETASQEDIHEDEAAQEMIQAFNVILSQHVLQQNIQEAGLIVKVDDRFIMIDDGIVLYQYFFSDTGELKVPDRDYSEAVSQYAGIHEAMAAQEEIKSVKVGANSFHVFVPFVPKGEFIGAIFIKNTPDFSFITREIISNYNETALIFAGLILFGLLAIFYISSYLVSERDEARELLYKEEEHKMAESIDRQKESLFTKRIYHTHHKSEKVMGFIKEDLRNLTETNIDESKYRVTKYANFMSRVIYDMKWYDPPLHAIRNPVFKTDLNEVIHFIVNNIFLRTTRNEQPYQFNLTMDSLCPPININEFVVWEIIEPLIQNSVDHGSAGDITIEISTAWDGAGRIIQLKIADNGPGISEELLRTNEQGIQRIFMENISTKNNSRNSGYGCYLAFEISKRCGWKIEAANIDTGGCLMELSIPA